MLYLKPVERKMKYPKWLIILFGISGISTLMSAFILIIDLIFALFEWKVDPFITNDLIWFAISFSVAFGCVVRASIINER